MRSIILIGDSIRMGYAPFVREVVADVWAPDENCWTSTVVRERLEEWVIARQPDIVHLNCGLHDIKRIDGNPPVTPLDDYRTNLDAIFGRILRETQARVIWATITPVNEAWHNARKEFDRLESDVAAYNAAALEVAARHALPVNDLHAIITAAGRDTLLQPDGVHFTQAGSRLLAQAVVRAIGL